MRRILLSFCATGALIGATAQAPYTPPVSLTIDSESALEQWTVINVDNDASAFAYSSSAGGAEVKEQRYADVNDWLISPAIELEAGVQYEIVFNCKKGSSFSSDYSRIKIYSGEAPNAEGQTELLYTNENITSSTFSDIAFSYTPSASGEQYIGLYCYNVAYKGGFVVKSLTVKKVLPYPGAISNLKAEAAAEGRLEAELSWTWPANDYLGSPLGALSGAKIYRGSTSGFTPDETTLAGSYTTDATPGSAAQWADITVPEPGRYYYKVVPFNDHGDSPVAPTAMESPWIGKDTGIGVVSNVEATIDPESDTTVFLTFDAPKGNNGGYIDPADVAYKIVRKGVSGGDVTLETAWQGEQPYKDRAIPGLDSYTYSIQSVYNGSTGYSTAVSNAIVAGGTAALPYTQDFNSSGSDALYTFFHGDSATRNWSRSSNRLCYWGNPADAWAVTPLFHLEKGKAYELTFHTHVSRTASPKNLSVCIGEGATAEALTREIYAETVNWQYAAQKRVVIAVAETGNYNIGFHCYGPSDSNDLYVDDITLAEAVILPKSVSGLSAEVAPEGELKVTLSWTNPSETTADTAIDTLDKVEILENGALAATLTEVAAGTESSQAIAVESAGEHTFTVVPYYNGEAGAPAEVTSSWVGDDTPVAPTNLTVTAGEDSRTISFDAVTEGVHGGYINSSDILYTISRNDDVLTDELATTEYTDKDTTLPLGKYTYSVTARFGKNESSATSSVPMILGSHLELPYEPDFSDKSTFDLWTMSKNANGNNHWSLESNGIKTGSSTAIAFTPPFHAWKGTIEVKSSASAWSSRYPSTYQVLLCTDNDTENPTVVANGDEHQLTSSWAENHTHNFEIKNAGKYYIGYKVTDNGMYHTLSDTSVRQTINTGIESATGEESGLSIGTDGTITVPCAGTLTIVTPSGVTVQNTPTNGETVDASGLEKGVYIGVWTPSSGATTSFKFIR